MIKIQFPAEFFCHICRIMCKIYYWNDRITGLLHLIDIPKIIKGSDGLMDKVSASQPLDGGFKSHTGYDHDSSYDTSTG